MKTMTRWRRWALLLLVATVLGACEETTGPTGSDLGDVRRDASDDAFDGAGTGGDRDQDGYLEGRGRGFDCNDDDPRINPGASEVCDDRGVDEDCNPCTVSGWIVRGGRLVNDGDGDGDGHWRTTCSNPATEDGCSESFRVARMGLNFVGMDCDDGDHARYRDCLGCVDGTPCTAMNCSVCGRRGTRPCDQMCRHRSVCRVGMLPPEEATLAAGDYRMRMRPPQGRILEGMTDALLRVRIPNCYGSGELAPIPCAGGARVIAYGMGIALGAGEYNVALYGRQIGGNVGVEVFAENGESLVSLPTNYVTPSSLTTGELASAGFSVPQRFGCHRIFFMVVSLGDNCLRCNMRWVELDSVSVTGPEEYLQFL